MKKLEIRWVNCAECDQEVLGESMQDWYDSLDLIEKANHRIVVGRIHGRPYCNICCGDEEIDVGSIIRKNRNWEEMEDSSDPEEEI
ncbi:hypothetical protein C4577_03650 [Candidatus Parcubacteria bacterium]|nr:MAG: hypothetical protein C4577_03650 [Candidatus Parcubacteria bacterium]